jgi:hypothetical protein
MLCLVRDVKLLGPLSKFIKSIERRVVKNNFTNGPENCETGLLNLINPSLEIGYCSTALSNHYIIRIVRFISKIKVGLWNESCH